jgi:hypothetical protein
LSIITPRRQITLTTAGGKDGLLMNELGMDYVMSASI